MSFRVIHDFTRGRPRTCRCGQRCANPPCGICIRRAARRRAVEAFAMPFVVAASIPLALAAAAVVLTVEVGAAALDRLAGTR